MYIILCFCKMFLATCQTNWMVAVTSKSGFYCPVATFPTTIHQNNRKVVFMVPRQPFFHKLNSRITISLWIIQEINVLLLLIIKMIYVFKIYINNSLFGPQYHFQCCFFCMNEFDDEFLFLTERPLFAAFIFLLLRPFFTTRTN